MQNNDRSVMALLNSVITTYSLLGLFKENPEKFLEKVEEKTKLDIPDEVNTLAEKRWQAKKDRDFKLADSLREEIQKLGYLVKDTRDGYDLSKI